MADADGLLLDEDLDVLEHDVSVALGAVLGGDVVLGELVDERGGNDVRHVVFGGFPRGRDGVRERLEDISGIGPKTSLLLAEYYPSEAAFRDVDREELQQIDGIGEATVELVLDEF